MLQHPLVSQTLLATLDVTQVLRILLERAGSKVSRGPQIGSQVLARRFQSSIGSLQTVSESAYARPLQTSKTNLDEVTESLGATSGVGVHILNSGIVEHLLDANWGNNSSSSRSRYETDNN